MLRRDFSVPLTTCLCICKISLSSVGLYCRGLMFEFTSLGKSRGSEGCQTKVKLDCHVLLTAVAGCVDHNQDEGGQESGVGILDSGFWILDSEGGTQGTLHEGSVGRSSPYPPVRQSFPLGVASG
jgi:hypothetical protein